jgi:hypothetical protein
MATALGRINGGEIIKYSEINQPFADADSTFYFVMTDPLVPDGTLLRELLPVSPGSARYGPPRQLGYAKIGILATNTIRNATQAEIDLFDDAEGLDEQAQDAAQAREQMVRHPLLARSMAALIRRLVATINEQNIKINTLVAQWEAYKIDMGNAAGVNAAQLRSRGATRPVISANLPDSLTPANVAQAIRNDIRADDAPRRRGR